MLNRGSYKGNLADKEIIKAIKFAMHSIFHSCELNMDSYSYAITQETMLHITIKRHYSSLYLCTIQLNQNSQMIISKQLLHKLSHSLVGKSKSLWLYTNCITDPVSYVNIR